MEDADVYQKVADNRLIYGVGAFPVFTPADALTVEFARRTVFEATSAYDLAWEWNGDAINQMALLGHTIGTTSLNKKVRRLPPKACTTGGSVLDALGAVEWDISGPEASIEVLLDSFRRAIDGAARAQLSLSAGYDSRTLLALSLETGLPISLTVMGDENSLDVVVAREVARKIGGDIAVFSIKPSDYIAHGEAIARDTSGVKLASNWHTWLYAKASAGDFDIHLVGSNGEFARTYYNHALARVLHRLGGGRRAMEAFFMVKAVNALRRYRLCRPLLSVRRLARSLRREVLVAEAYPSRIYQCLDFFYCVERVRHFIGSGIACYAAFGQPRSPFLDVEWIAATASVRRNAKQRETYPRAVIKRFAPQLNDIPFNDVTMTAGLKKDYNNFADVVLSSEAREIVGSSNHLDALLDRKTRQKAIDDSSMTPKDVELLLTLHFAGANVRG